MKNTLVKSSRDRPSAIGWQKDGISFRAEAERRFVPKPDGWAARWIWLNRSAYPDRQTCRATLFCGNGHPYAVGLFRKAFHLPFEPRRATAWISGDTKYRCWINGRKLASGPSEVGGDYGNTESPTWWYYEGVEAGAGLERGSNVIAAEVVLGPQVQADYSMGRGGFLFELAVEGEHGESLTIATDGTWRAIVSAADAQPHLYDARQETGGWMTAGFDDSRWPQAGAVSAPEAKRWNLLPREIPMLAEARVPPVARLFASAETGKRARPAPASRGLFPVRLKPGCPLAFWLRFPRELAGHLVLDLAGAEGTCVDLDFQESLGLPGQRERYILPGRPWSYETRRLQGFEYVQVTVSFPGGSQCRTPLEIRAIDAVFTSFPVEYRGRFACSDPFLNRLWSVGRWTTQLCMQAYHLDSPIHQEGLGCTGDYMIESLISYRCFGEARLARQDILRTACLLRQKRGRMFHTSYSLLWVWMLRDYWMNTDDEATVREVMATMHGLLDLFASYVGPTGLITEAPNYMFMDWVGVGGYNLHHPPASMGQGYMSAFYFRALRFGAELARLCGDVSRAKTYDRRAAALKRAFIRRLWDRARGLYRDGMPGVTKVRPSQWLPADPEAASFTVQTNALAVAVGIVPPDLRPAIMRKILEDASLPLVQPYFLHFVFEALAEANLFETDAFGLMARWKRLLDEHPSSLKEMWNSGDYSHAWGGTPTYQLSTRVLGVSPRKPGFRAMALRPCLGPLRTAKGVVPTPLGPVSLAWKKTGGALSGALTGPAGCEMVLEGDDAVLAGTTIRQNGRSIAGVKKTPGALGWTLNGGEYQIETIVKSRVAPLPSKGAHR